MLHILENDALRVAIDDHGAQLMSIIGKKDGTEYLWQGDARYWGDRAIMLFPICGRLEEGRYTYGGKSYDMMAPKVAMLIKNFSSNTCPFTRFLAAVVSTCQPSTR